MYIYKEDAEKAIACFEVVHKQFPENYDTLKVLGSLYASTKKEDKAAAMLKRITEMQPRDADAWIELGNARSSASLLNSSFPLLTLTNTAHLVEQTDIPRALRAYEKALKLLSAQKTVECSFSLVKFFHLTPFISNLKVSPEILNNIGALHHQLKQYDTAETFYHQV